MTWRALSAILIRIGGIVMAAALLMTLLGCAAMDALYDKSRWEWDGFQVATYTWHVEPDQLKCGFLYDLGTRHWGCAVRVRDNTPQSGAKPVPGVDPSVGGHCFIYSSVDEESARRITSIHGDNLRDHERKHCRGFVHPRR